MATVVGMLVEFKAKSTEIDSTFKKVSTQMDAVNSKAKTVGSSFDNVSNKVTAMGKSLLNYGKWVAAGLAVAATGLLVAINKIADSIDNMTDKARELGVGAQGLQALTYAAGQSGVSFDELSQSISIMNRTLGNVYAGKTKLDFLDVNQLKGQDVDRQIVTILEGLGQIKDKNEQAAAASEIFGRSYTKMLSLARDGIKENIEEFNKLGLALTDQQRSAVDAYGDAKNRLESIWTGFSQKVVAYVAPAFTKIVDFISDTIEKMGGIDKAAQGFAKAIISGVRVAIEAMQGLLNIINKIEKAFLGIQGIRLENQIQNEETAQRGYGRTIAERLGIASETKVEPNEKIKQLSKELEVNQARWNEINNNMKARADFLKPLDEMLEQATNKIGDTTKDLDGVIAGASKGVKGFSQSVEAATKKIDDVISKMISAAGEKGLNRILKLDENGKEIKQVESQQVDNLVKQIYDKALNGSGGKTLSGMFNGQQINSYETTAAQDYEQLKKLVGDNLRGRTDLRAYQEQVGIIEALKPFVDKINPQTQKVDVNIKVEPSDLLITKVIHSQENKQMIDNALLDATRKALTMGAK